MHPRDADLEALLQALVDAGIEFIVVGGVAAILHGAPTTTQDLDIVHRTTPENVDRGPPEPAPHRPARRSAAGHRRPPPALLDWPA